MDEGRNFQTIQTFFEGQGSNLVGGFSTLALSVKASALIERANQLSMNWDHRKTSFVFLKSCLNTYLKSQVWPLRLLSPMTSRTWNTQSHALCPHSSPYNSWTRQRHRINTPSSLAIRLRTLLSSISTIPLVQRIQLRMKNACGLHAASSRSSSIYPKLTSIS